MKSHSRFRAGYWYSLAAIAALVVVADTETASADCNTHHPVRSVSASKEFGLEVDFGRKTSFAVTRKGEIIASGELDVSGHHLTGLIDDTGAFFLLHDLYEGLTIYNGTGQLLRRFTARQLLSFREQRIRPGKWACHAEGQWSSANNPLSFGPDGTSVVLFTHAEREIVIDLASARVVQEEQDQIQLSIVLRAAFSLLVVGMFALLWRCSKRTRLAQNDTGADSVH